MKAALHPRCVFVAVLAVAGAVPAADPPELLQLKNQRNAALAKSVQELTEVYKTQLQDLQKKFRASKDNAGIAATTDELVKLGVTSA